GATLTLNSKFAFRDRGREVPLTTSLRAGLDYTPQAFAIKGNTCRSCPIDTEVGLDAGTARVRQEKETRTLVPPRRFFTIAGYAPVALQMAMMRYWRTHSSPAVLPVLPSGEVRILDRGPESFDLDGRKIALHRYSVRGLIWGLQTLWMDEHNNL